MTIEFKPSDSPGEEDSWAKLASNLFGINFTQSDAPPPELPTPVAETAPEEDEDEPETDEEAVAAIDIDDAEEADLVPAEAAADADDVDEQDDEQDDEDVLEDNTRDESNEETDTFWDALNGWDWGDEPSSEVEQKPKSGRRSSRGRSTPSPARTSSRSDKPTERVERGRFEETDVAGESAAAFRDEYVDDSDFGAGLLSENDTTAGVSQTDGESPAADSETEEARPKRRRRRRRRRPSRKKETTEAAENSESEEVAEPSIDADETETAVNATDDGSADSDDSESKPANEKRRPRRRSRRRRKPAQTEENREEQTDEAFADVSTDPDDDFGADLTGDETVRSEQTSTTKPAKDGERKTPANKIPTWEEAISYLLQKQPAKSESATSPKKSSRSSSGRRRGGRRSSKSTKSS